MAVFGAALMVVLFALIFSERRRGSLVLAAILAYFSLDDVVQVHEMVGWDFATGLGMPEYMGGRMFLVLYAPLFAIAAVLLWQVGRYSRGWSPKVITFGLGLLALAIAAEGLGGVLQFATDGDFAGSAAHELEIAFEEGAELGGWILIATALAVALALRIGDSWTEHLGADRSSTFVGNGELGKPRPRSSSSEPDNSQADAPLQNRPGVVSGKDQGNS